MSKYSEAQKLAVARYQKKAYDDVRFRVPKGYRETTLAPAAEASGLSMNAFIRAAIEEKISRDVLLPARDDDPEEIPPAL